MSYGVHHSFLAPISVNGYTTSTTEGSLKQQMVVTMTNETIQALPEIQHTNSSSATKKNRRKRKRGKVAPPKPGEEGYLTPTQLRNARKRRAKTSSAPPEKDPSSQYLGNPKSAPICQTAKEYFRSLQQDFAVRVGPTKGWRTVAKLAVRGDLSIGLFAPHSHRLISVPDCTAHHSSINAAVSHVEQSCRLVGVTAFDDATGQGHLRFVAMNVERTTGLIQMTIVWNSHPYNYDHDDHHVDDDDDQNNVDNHITIDDCNKGDTIGKKRLDSLLKILMPSTTKTRRRGIKKTVDSDKACTTQKVHFHSLWVHFNSSWKHSNAIFSTDAGPKSWKHVFGPTDIVEYLTLPDQPKPVPLHFPPNVFRQANLDAFATIVATIRSKIHDVTQSTTQGSKPTCVELYGGVGTIGLNVADLVSTLTSSDENPYNKICFDTSAQEAGLTNVMYDSKNATNMVLGGTWKKAEVILVDPPRKGLEEPVMKSLCASSNAKLLVYVSCGFEAFQRDCSALLESGHWKLDHAEGHLLFPGSDAIETLAFFRSTNN